MRTECQHTIDPPLRCLHFEAVESWGAAWLDTMRGLGTRKNVLRLDHGGFSGINDECDATNHAQDMFHPPKSVCRMSGLEDADEEAGMTWAGSAVLKCVLTLATRQASHRHIG